VPFLSLRLFDVGSGLPLGEVTKDAHDLVHGAPSFGQFCACQVAQAVRRISWEAKPLAMVTKKKKRESVFG
jgi:hypothetical protein